MTHDDSNSAGKSTPSSGKAKATGTTVEFGRGVAKDKLTDAIAASGYPLQWNVANQLLPHLNLIEEWSYTDRFTSKSRALDLLATATISLPEHFVNSPQAVALIECKSSPTPYVFFRAVGQELPRNFPLLVGMPDAIEVRGPHEETTTVRMVRVIHASDHEFLSKGPPIARSFAHVYRKGKKLRLSGRRPFRGSILPLVSAHHHAESIFGQFDWNQAWRPQITSMICVLDAPMVLASYDASELNLEPTEWIRAVYSEAARNESRPVYRQYVIEFVHVDFVREFLVSRFLPFSRWLSERLGLAYPILGDPPLDRVTNHLPSWDDLMNRANSIRQANNPGETRSEGDGRP